MLFMSGIGEVGKIVAKFLHTSWESKGTETPCSSIIGEIAVSGDKCWNEETPCILFLSWCMCCVCSLFFLSLGDLFKKILFCLIDM